MKMFINCLINGGVCLLSNLKIKQTLVLVSGIVMAVLAAMVAINYSSLSGVEERVKKSTKMFLLK